MSLVPDSKQVASERRRNTVVVVVLLAGVIVNLVLAARARGADPLRDNAMAFVALALLVFGVPGFIWWRQRRWARFQAENEAALAKLREGDVDTARALLESMLERWKRPAVLSKLAQLNLAFTEILTGELERARQRLEKIEAERNPRERSGFSTLVPCRLAWVCALQGELDAAKRWLSTSRERVGGDAANRGVIEFWETATETVLASRAGEAGRARELLESRWSSMLEHADSGARWMHGLRAFVLDSSPSRERRSEVESALRGMRDVDRRGLRHLGVNWPEMRAFLVRENLG